MIISRTPYRISFFGGGTDYKVWYEKYGGTVLSTTINHYSYVYARFLPPFFKYKHKFIWSSLIEMCNDYSEASHNIIKAAIKYLNISQGLEINHQEDLPSKSGIGSSSAFTVGLLNALYALLGDISSKRQLSCEAVHIERELLNDSIGIQDQIAVAHGGLNQIIIKENGDFCVKPIILQKQRMEELESHFLLFFSGLSRRASEIAEKKVQSIPQKESVLFTMQELVEQAINIITSSASITEFGELLHQTWLLKKSISSSISNSTLDVMYERAKAAGAIGGKLLGAGGGGFMLFFVKPEHQPAVKEALKDFLWVPFKFENSGSNIVFHDTQQYSFTSATRRDFYHLKPRMNQILETN